MRFSFSFVRGLSELNAAADVSVWARLAAAYALNGGNDEASQYFSKALTRADGYEARKPILEFASRFDDLLSALSRRQPDDPQLQLALARKLAERELVLQAARVTLR